MLKARPVKLVTFDAMNTIINLKEPMGLVYTRFAASNGIVVGRCLTVDIVWNSFLKTYKKMNVERPCFAHSAGKPAWQCNKMWWMDLVKTTLTDASGTIPKDSLELEKTASDLYDFYQTTDAWTLEPSITTTLPRLKADGYRLAVLSNYDTRLREILRKFDLLNYFEHLFLSGELGVEKPNSKIFEAVEKTTGLSKNEILHIGDDVEKDYLAAKRRGWRAVILRSKPNKAVEDSDKCIDADDIIFHIIDALLKLK